MVQRRQNSVLLLDRYHRLHQGRLQYRWVRHQQGRGFFLGGGGGCWGFFWRGGFGGVFVIFKFNFRYFCYLIKKKIVEEGGS